MYLLIMKVINIIYKSSQLLKNNIKYVYWKLSSLQDKNLSGTKKF